MDDCVDDATFDNGSGATCAAYSQWCADGGARPGSEWALGAQFNHPERHCCACGKPGAAEEAETAADSEEIAGRAELRQAAERRADACAALAPRTAPSFALVYWRLPRVGNALMCAVLGACSHAQVETCAAAPGGHVVDACAAGAPWQYTDYASAKLPAASRSCFQRLDDLPLGGDQAAGWANLEATCSTMGGDVAATCSYLRGLAQPATAMVRLQRFVEPTAAPCRRAQFWRNSGAILAQFSDVASPVLRVQLGGASGADDRDAARPGRARAERVRVRARRVSDTQGASHAHAHAHTPTHSA